MIVRRVLLPSPVSPSRRFGLTVLGILLFLSICTQDASALSFTITDPNRTVLPGSTSLFSGTIMNDTGVDLNASDLFLNFSGFDPGVVSLTQVLGDTDFVIPNATTTPQTPLFQATLGTTAMPGVQYLADVILQDSAGNITAAETVSLQTAVPEPSSVAFVVIGFGAMLAGTRIRRRRI
jgi:hypothetical protein